MSTVYIFSGPCGCGKTTLAKAYSKYIANRKQNKKVYVIHGDVFAAGFTEPDNRNAHISSGKILEWEDILKFNWDCILTVAQKALDKGLDVIIDYVVEDELPLVQELARKYGAKLYYIVLTASCDTIKERLNKRGDSYLTERALFLKNKLDNLPENQGHLLNNVGKSVEDELEQLKTENFILE